MPDPARSPNPPVSDGAESLYTGAGYAERNPTWHVEDSAWKARQIVDLVRRNRLSPSSICDVGCGAGEVLRRVCDELRPAQGGVGFDISTEAFERARGRSGGNVSFVLGDPLDDDRTFDLLMCIDVFEHVEDYLGFLRRIRTKGRFAIFHIPLELSVQAILRRRFLPRNRESLGHLHYFTRDLALMALHDAGHEALAHRFTAGSLETPGKSLNRRIARGPRHLLRRVNEDLAARLLGGFSLLVLTRPS